MTKNIQKALSMSGNGNGVKPRYNPIYIAAGRGPWTSSTPRNVIVIDPGHARESFHKDDMVELKDGRQLSLKAAHEKGELEFDVAAAQGYVDRLLDMESKNLKALKRKFNDQHPLILHETVDPILSRGEKKPKNALPSAYAQALSERLGWKCAPEIRKLNPSGRKKATFAERLIKQPLYTGDIILGQNYLIVEDHIHSGTTIANMSSCVESQGGHVIGATVLNNHEAMTHIDGSENAVLLQPSKITLERVKRQIGTENLVRLHRAFFGAEAEPSECRFTDGELMLLHKHIETYVVPSITNGHTPKPHEIFQKLVDDLVPLAIQREKAIHDALGIGKVERVKSEIEQLQEGLKKNTHEAYLAALAPRRGDNFSSRRTIKDLGNDKHR